MKKDISLEMLSEILHFRKRLLSRYQITFPLKYVSRFKTRMFLFDHARLANGDTQNSHD